MRFTFGSRRLPADVAIDPDDRVLTHARTAQGGYAVATDRALYLPGGTRLPWYTIDRGVWDEDGLRILTTKGETHSVSLPSPGRLPEAVRERVTNSIVASRHVPLTDLGGVRLVARRVPGKDQPVWELLFDAGLDPSDPGLRALAEQALEEVRRSLGV
jgi:hypothetical protein